MTLIDPLLKTRQVAEALHVSGSTIKRWVDSGAMAASRTVGKHRLILLSEALSFARRQGLPVTGLEALSGASPVKYVVDCSAAATENLVERLVGALQRTEVAQAREIIRGVVAEPGGAVFLADQLIRPVMQRLGQGWAKGAIDVHQEHQATLILTTILLELNANSTRVFQAPVSVALGATPESDPYHLPLLLGELVLKECGWNVRSLGVNLPLRSLAAAVREYRPRLIFLSVSHLADKEQFARDYLDFYETAAAQEVAVMVGGRALDQDLLARLVYAGSGERMAHLAEFAKRLDPQRVGIHSRLNGAKISFIGTTQSSSG